MAQKSMKGKQDDSQLVIYKTNVTSFETILYKDDNNKRSSEQVHWNNITHF